MTRVATVAIHQTATGDRSVAANVRAGETTMVTCDIPERHGFLPSGKMPIFSPRTEPTHRSLPS